MVAWGREYPRRLRLSPLSDRRELVVLRPDIDETEEAVERERPSWGQVSKLRPGESVEGGVEGEASMFERMEDERTSVSIDDEDGKPGIVVAVGVLSEEMTCTGTSNDRDVVRRSNSAIGVTFEVAGTGLEASGPVWSTTLDSGWGCLPSLKSAMMKTAGWRKSPSSKASFADGG